MNTVSKSPKTLKKHENTFHIEWKDGHASWYPYRYLRQMCPCAECAIIRHKGKDIHSLFSPQGDGDVTLIEVSEDNSTHRYPVGGSVCSSIQLDGWTQYRHLSI